MRSQIKALAIILLCMVVGLVLGVFSPKEREGATGPRIADTVALTMGNMTFRAQVADSDDERARGLSGRPSLASNEALLVVFPYQDAWGIWMKDMLFPIDIVWADAEMRVIMVREGVAPETYPEAFRPSSPALYVVELPAGSASRHGIVPGGKIIF